MQVQWYRDSTLLENQTYNVDSANYFCDTQVSSYNKIVITIGNMTKADRHLKIYNISDGMTRQFYNDELQNIEIIEQITNNNRALNINEADLTILPLTTTGVLFQRTLPFSIYRNDVLLGQFFISSSKSNTNKTIYSLEVSDYMNLLEGQTYLGGTYSNTLASTLIADILTGIPYTLDATLGTKAITGYLPILNKREALREVAFCINALVDTSRSDEIVIKPFPTATRTIPPSEIVSIETIQTNITTEIDLRTTVLTTQNASSDDIFSGTISGTQMIVFDSPKYDLQITGGTITTSNINYAIISGSGAVTLSGKTYELATTLEKKTNPYVVSTDIEKIETYDTTLTCDTPILDNLKFVQYNIKSKFMMRATTVGSPVIIDGKTCRVMKLNYNCGQTAIWCDAELEAYYG